MRRVPGHGGGAHGRTSGAAGAGTILDLTWITDRIALGGGIWNEANMLEVVRQGVTHIVDMQIEFDDTRLAAPYEVKVLWNPVDDDFEPKSSQVFERGVNFAQAALSQNEEHKIFVHCAAGVHRAPMMTLAILGAMGWDLKDAMQSIQSKRPVVDWADVYVSSVKRYLNGHRA